MSCPCNSGNKDCLEWSELCIGDLWFFKGLKKEELIALASLAVRNSFEVGVPVFNQGDLAQSIYLIKSGHIRLSRVAENGTETILDVRKPGDFLGEHILTDLADDYCYPVSAFCLDEVRTCGFTRKKFEDLIVEFPAIGLTVIRNMANHINALTERIEAISQPHLEEKIVGVLLNIAREYGTICHDGRYALELPLTHEDLGFLVGAHRVSVTRVLKKLKQNGRIVKEGKLLVVSEGIVSTLSS